MTITGLSQYSLVDIEAGGISLDKKGHSPNGNNWSNSHWSQIYPGPCLFLLLWLVVFAVDLCCSWWMTAGDWLDISQIDWNISLQRFIAVSTALCIVPAVLFVPGRTLFSKWASSVILGFTIESLALILLAVMTLIFHQLFYWILVTNLHSGLVSVGALICVGYLASFCITIVYSILELMLIFTCVKWMLSRQDDCGLQAIQSDKTNGLCGYTYGGAIGFGVGMASFLSVYIFTPYHFDLIPLALGLDVDQLSMTIGPRAGLIIVKSCLAAIIGRNWGRSPSVQDLRPSFWLLALSLVLYHSFHWFIGALFKLNPFDAPSLSVFWLWQFGHIAGIAVFFLVVIVCFHKLLSIRTYEQRFLVRTSSTTCCA